MTPSQSRRFYNRLHADDERNVDALTLGLWVALGVLGWLLAWALGTAFMTMAHAALGGIHRRMIP